MTNPNERVRVLNQETGQVGTIKRRLFEKPRFNPNGLLVEVGPEQKPYLPEMFKSRVATEEEAHDEPKTEEA